MIKVATALPLKSNLENDESMEMLKNKRISESFNYVKNFKTF